MKKVILTLSTVCAIGVGILCISSTEEHAYSCAGTYVGIYNHQEIAREKQQIGFSYKIIKTIMGTKTDVHFSVNSFYGSNTSISDMLVTGARYTTTSSNSVSFNRITKQVRYNYSGNDLISDASSFEGTCVPATRD